MIVGRILPIVFLSIVVILISGCTGALVSSPTPTPIPAATPCPTPTPTPTPVPQGGAGTGTGAATPTVTPAPTATPTPKPQPTVAVLTNNGNWPFYDFHWTEHPTVTPVPTATPASSTVGFNDLRSNLWNTGDGFRHNIYSNWAPSRGVWAYDNETAVVVTIQLNRSGDLSSSYTVPVVIGNFDEYYTDHDEVLGIQYATFDADESTADMTLVIDRAFAYDTDNRDMMMFTIVPSSEYNIMEPYTWGEDWDGGNVFYFDIGLWVN